MRWLTLFIQMCACTFLVVFGNSEQWHSALVINGNPDGSADAARMASAIDVCRSAHLMCERVPAQFIRANARNRPRACLQQLTGRVQSEHEMGLWFSHVDAWRRVVRYNAPRFVFEDDVSMPAASHAAVRRAVNRTLRVYGHVDLVQFGSYAEAYYVTPRGARKLLQLFGECIHTNIPVDHAMWNHYCTSNMLVCKSAPTLPSAAWHLCGHGIACDGGVFKQNGKLASYRIPSALTHEKRALLTLSPPRTPPLTDSASKV